MLCFPWLFIFSMSSSEKAAASSLRMTDKCNWSFSNSVMLCSASFLRSSVFFISAFVCLVWSVISIVFTSRSSSSHSSGFWSCLATFFEDFLRWSIPCFKEVSAMVTVFSCSRSSFSAAFVSFAAACTIFSKILIGSSGTEASFHSSLRAWSFFSSFLCCFCSDSLVAWIASSSLACSSFDFCSCLSSSMLPLISSKI